MIYLVIVNYYSSSLIRGLLTSVPDSQVSVIIVNNSPQDAEIEQLVQDFPKTTLIQANANLGFGAGCNLGIEFVYQTNPQAFVWLLNPDTLLKPFAIQSIQHCFQQYPNLAILGTRIQDSQGNLWFSEGKFNPWLGSLKHQSSLRENSDQNSVKVIPSRWVSGCSLILNLSQFKDCPKFDPHYFLYYEDNDLCERYYQQGYAIAVTEAVLVEHLVSATTEKDQSAKFEHATYSKLYFLKRYGQPLGLWLNIFYMLIKIGLNLEENRSISQGRWRGLKKFLFSQEFS